MTIELTILIAILSAGLSAYGTLTATKHRHKAEVQKETVAMTTVLLKLENIGSIVSEIKGEMTGVKNDVKEFQEKIIRLEESVKQAHRRLDNIESQDRGAAD